MHTLYKCDGFSLRSTSMRRTILAVETINTLNHYPLFNHFPLFKMIC